MAQYAVVFSSSCRYDIFANTLVFYKFSEVEFLGDDPKNPWAAIPEIKEIVKQYERGAGKSAVYERVSVIVAGIPAKEKAFGRSYAILLIGNDLIYIEPVRGGN